MWNPGPEKAAKLDDLPPTEFRCFLCDAAANAPGAEVAVAPGGHHVLPTRLAVD